MKNHFSALLLLLSSLTIFAQTDTSVERNPSNKFEIAVIPKLGFGKVAETGSTSTNGFVNGGDFLFTIKAGKNKYINISAGIGYFEFWGNKIVEGNTADLRNAYLHLPLIIGGDINLYKNNKPENQRVFLNAGIGFYGNDQIKQEIETISGSFSNSNLGWNFGFTTQLGLNFKVSDLLDLGVGYEIQADLSEMKKDGIERKVENASTINFTLAFKL